MTDRWLQLNPKNKCGEIIGAECSCKWHPDKPGGLEAKKVTDYGNAVGFIAYTHFSKEEFKLLKSLGNGEEPYDNYESQSTEIIHKLDGFACSYRNYVTINLTKGGTSQISYCCNKHGKTKKDGSAKVRVDQVTIRCKDHGESSSLKAYKHSVNQGVDLAGIRYYDNGQYGGRRKINLKKVPFPIQDSPSAYAFYCNQNTPVLLYLNYNGQNDVKGWYQKDKLTNSDNGSEEWIKVENLDKIMPNDLGNLTCKQWSDLKKELDKHGDNGLEECPDGAKQLEQQELEQESLSHADGGPTGKAGDDSAAASLGGDVPPGPEAPDEDGKGPTGDQVSTEKIDSPSAEQTQINVQSSEDSHKQRIDVSPGQATTQDAAQSGDGNGGQPAPDETNTSTTQAATSTSESTRTEGSPDPQPAQAVTGLEVVGGATGLGSIISGVFGGSAATFFGTCKLTYNKEHKTTFIHKLQWLHQL
ncbi:hypothetical protein BEWA_029300 [Theileria equi strain WA]|uniref:Uncharacterized protein n=1 Tax=Theileria equi strain WA TaxID=1537102 RepID=L0AWZ5_THEEQ|nr:hypothetical protein BEWA_029300 [Theileria equi strain WA]AFZ80080.1 hypothetical protein BEWA_029300 [Theileria equi strain WA]|eukprot:XP_004829746.1 hypothetical protein BEWA_029300 [Theileria equi strain WA]